MIDYLTGKWECPIANSTLPDDYKAGLLLKDILNHVQMIGIQISIGDLTGLQKT